MVELREQPDGTLTRAFGGDTLNTAIYLARLGVQVDYITALGDDPWSDEMVCAWRAEGVGTSQVRRLQNSLPGLYIIQTDPAGERRFLYWRDSAAARRVFDLPDSEVLLESLSHYDLLFFSGITLSIYDAAGREKLFAAAEKARRRGGRVAFDTNFRPRGWPNLNVARSLYEKVFSSSDIVFASTEDLRLLFGDEGVAILQRDAASSERVLKFDRPAVSVTMNGAEALIEAPPISRVVDTTAAGDSFAAAYLASRLQGASPIEAARAGHRLAGAVVRHPGAIIPPTAMPLEIIR
jgi:2-dehydro-3-deoxygluconokinase